MRLFIPSSVIVGLCAVAPAAAQQPATGALGLAASAMSTGPLVSTTAPPISVVYFDLGNTLVARGPDGPRRIWIAGAPDALTRLHQAGFRLGVLSNTGPLGWDEVLTGILPEDFDPTLFDPDLIVVSSAVGAEKPDPRIFQYAIDRAGVPPSAIVFITETMEHVFAAQAAGMRALWVGNGALPQLVDDLIGLAPQRDTSGG